MPSTTSQTSGELGTHTMINSARSRGVARELLAALESSAHALGYRRLRLDTGPKQVHALNLYRQAGYVPVDPYNENPFASFWGEKDIDRPSP